MEHWVPTDMSHVRHEDDVKTQKAFVEMYDFMYSISSQRTWKVYSDCHCHFDELAEL